MTRTCRGLAIALAAVLVPSGAALAQVGPGYYYGHGEMMDGAWGWLGGAFMMVFFIAVIVGVVVVFLRMFGHEPTRRSSSRALDILNERFARGEIDRTEYEERRRALQDEGRG